MRIPIRPRGPWDVLNDGKSDLQKRVSIVNKLAQLEGERDRISQERANWQEKIDLIDARLTQIGEVQERLQDLLTHPDLAPPSVGEVAADSRNPLAGQVAVPDEVATLRH